MVYRDLQFAMLDITAAQDNVKGIDLNLSFEPSPDYPRIAAAAGKAWVS
jgi:hypothetical protein